MGGSGVQRPLKFAKYLKEYGWEPVVLAPDAGAYHTFDESLLDELNRSDIRTIRVGSGKVFKPGLNKSGSKFVNSRLAAFLRKVTSWFLLPDNKKGWIKPALEKAEKIIGSEPIDAIFSTAPPYSNLLLATKLKKRTSLPLIMDLRDDWLHSHLINYPTRWHYRKMKELESATLPNADLITVVNDHYRTNIKQRLGEKSPPVKVIPNGYDRENFEHLKPAGDPQKFTILYSGLFYGSRKPDWLLESVKLAFSRNRGLMEDLQVQFQGGLDQTHWKVINKLGLTDSVADFGYTDHSQAVQNLVNADLLFLTLGEREYIEAVTPGKLFEYFGSMKPILAFVPNGATTDLLKRYKAAKWTGIKNVEKGADAIEEFYALWKKGELPEGNGDFADKFERRFTAQQLAYSLDQITGY